MASQRKDKFVAKSNDNAEVLSILVNLFGDVLHVDVIKSVALNCQWNLETASNILAELTSSVSNNKIKKPELKQKKKILQPNANRNISSINSIGYAAAGDQNDDVDVLIEGETNTIFSAASALNYRQAFETAKKKVINTPPKKNKPPPPPIQNKSKREIEYERVVAHIRTGAKVLVLLRGLPGSGKSHMAKMIVTSIYNEDPRRFVYSTDEFFEKNGVYRYNPNLLSDAHSWNQRRVFEVMKMGLSPIIIDNTNTEMWEMKCYAEFAVQFGYAVEILEPYTAWIFNAAELTRRNTHGVPKEKIANMLDRYEKNIKPAALLTFSNLRYKPSNYPPQPRLYPPLIKNKPVPLMSYNIPASIARFSGPNFVTKNEIKPANEAQIAENQQPKPKKKRARKKKNNSTNGQNSDSASTISKSESMHSILTNDDSDSDIDTLNELQKNDSGYSLNVRDVFHDKPDVTKSNNFYDLLVTSNDSSSDNQNATNNVEIDDLINFNDADDNGKTNFSSDLISLENKENTIDNSNKKISDVQLKTAELIDSCVRLFKAVTTKETSNQNKNLLNDNSDYPKLDLSSWGISEEALISWELVETPKSKIQPKQTQIDPQPQREVFRQLSNDLSNSNSSPLNEVSTNTSSEDFRLLKQDVTNDLEVKILRTENRNINENFVNKLPQHLQSSVHVDDKSTMTGEENVLNAALVRNRCNTDDGTHFSTLLNLFPSIEQHILKDIFDKCQGDVNWAVDLLLEGNYKDVVFSENPQNETSNVCNAAILDYSTVKYNNITENILPQNTAQTPTDVNVHTPEIIKSASKIKNKMSQETFKEFEDKFKINDSHYSTHVANLRKKRYGECDPIPSTSKIETQTPAPATAYNYSEANQNMNEDNESESNSEDDLIEMNVGMNFIEQLEENAGNTDLEYPQGFQPVVQLPVSLVRQLHAYWIESVYQQMEAQQKVLEDMELEDEEFARKLQEEEKKTDVNQTPIIPNLQEIMDMEIALAIYKADTEQWKNETPDDLASRLKRQKLFETFPNFDQGALVEILHSCDNSFDQTVEVLRAADDGQNLNQDVSVEAKQKELLENAKKECNEAKKSTTPSIEFRSIAAETIQKTATEYREEAQLQMKLREDNFRKAKEAMQKGQSQVALYYSEIARLHIKKCEHANSLAAVAFLASQSKDAKTLDLHFLLGKEAEQAVSVFIDEQVSRLRTINKLKDSIFIITGRGKHSKNGAVIKPIIMNKLKKRGLKFTQMNPGLLKVNIYKHSLMTNDLNE